ncbi:LytTR family transcriptional regulator DNA-binding domain-containing protein [Paenibacillus flagellatus]|nr:LytTR family transcriptional regulator DNA-binding domain-containing protein [Paenibacillus flagellatus]
MVIPVLRRIGEQETELVLLDLNDVLYINIEKRNIVYHTLDEKYYHMSTLSELYDHFFDNGFDLLDKTNLVNLNKIKKLDNKQGKVYFEENPTGDSKYATVAFIKQKLFQNVISRAIANNTNTSLEYTAKPSNESFRILPRTSEE